MVHSTATAFKTVLKELEALPYMVAVLFMVHVVLVDIVAAVAVVPSVVVVVVTRAASPCTRRPV